jgi:hypothetical protein
MSRGFTGENTLRASVSATLLADSRALFADQAESFRFLAITPFERPDVRLARALRRQQTAVAIDIGHDKKVWPGLFSADATRLPVGPMPTFCALTACSACRKPSKSRTRILNP